MHAHALKDSMEVIRSTSNSKVQYLRKLSNKKFRETEGVFVAEGVNLIKDIPENILVKSVFLAESKVESLREIWEKYSSVFVLEDRIFQSISDTVTPSGILAIVALPEKKTPTSKRLMVLDRVSDSGNVGTIIRTAVACGFGDIVMLSGADPFSQKAVRSSMGGVFSANITVMTEEEFLKLGYPLYVLDMAGENLYQFSPQEKFALVVGSESLGISSTLRAKADKVLSIPMEKMESLNAGVSASIAMYQLKYNCK